MRIAFLTPYTQARPLPLSMPLTNLSWVTHTLSNPQGATLYFVLGKKAWSALKLAVDDATNLDDKAHETP